VKWKNSLERHVVMIISLLQRQVDRTIVFLDMSGQDENILEISHLEELIDNELGDIYSLSIKFLASTHNETEILAILTLLELALKIEESSDLILSNIRMLRELPGIPEYTASVMKQMLEILKETYGDLVPLSAPFKLKPEQRDMVIDIQYRQITEVLEEEDIPRSSMIVLGRISRHIELLGDTAKETIRLKQIYLDALTKIRQAI